MVTVKKWSGPPAGRCSGCYHLKFAAGQGCRAQDNHADLPVSCPHSSESISSLCLSPGWHGLVWVFDHESYDSYDSYESSIIWLRIIRFIRFIGIILIWPQRYERLQRFNGRTEFKFQVLLLPLTSVTEQINIAKPTIGEWDGVRISPQEWRGQGISLIQWLTVSWALSSFCFYFLLFLC